MKLKDFLVEAQATVSDIATAVKDANIDKMTLELVKRKMFDRALTDYSTAWQRTYFSDSTNKKGGVYPNGKKRSMDRAEEDQNEIVDFYGKISKETKNLITDKAVLSYFAKEDKIDNLKAFLTGPYQEQLKQSGQLYPTNESVMIEGEQFYIYERLNLDTLKESLNITCSGNIFLITKILDKISKDPNKNLALIPSNSTNNGEDGIIIKDEKSLNSGLVSILSNTDKSSIEKLKKMFKSSKVIQKLTPDPKFSKKEDIEAVVKSGCDVAEAIMKVTGMMFGYVGKTPISHLSVA